MNDRVTIDLHEGVADVRLTRADKMNALDEAMFEALIAAADTLARASGLRAVVLSGAGRAFCAGLDMSRFMAMANPQEGLAGLGDLSRRTHGFANRPQWAAWAWRALPVPVIAAVHGVAFGGGFQIALGADMRLAAPDCRFSAMEIRWGLVPDLAGTQLMRLLARDDVVRELTYTGRIFDAAQAFDYGFVTRICDDPRAEALALAADIAAKNPHAVRAAKRLLNLPADAALGLQAESDEQARLLASPNQIEATRAQLMKQTPRFTDVDADG